MHFHAFKMYFYLTLLGFISSSCMDKPGGGQMTREPHLLTENSLEVNSSRERARCLELIDDNQFERIEGFNGRRYFVFGYVTIDREQNPEGCFLDDSGTVEWFAGEWVSLCLIESRDQRGKYLQLQTDDCWCERCFP